VTVDTEAAVAVVGMACRFPGAGSVPEYWAMLRAGVEGISHFEPAELVAAGADPDLVLRPDFVAAKGVLAGAERFDWSFFGYSRAEAASIDPQHRVFLECASAAIDDAGIDPGRFPGWIGVYAGAESVRARTDLGSLADVIGQEKDFLTTRVAYKLGLRGPAITVQTACSTSLTAVHLAVQGLLGYECDAALAGGVAAEPRGRFGYVYRDGGIASPDGHCRPFDADGAGTVPSEGVGVVVLKRLADAVRDGDRIAAVIAGSAVNNDGGDKVGYTAPGIPGQRDVIRLALKVAGVGPAAIGYVEAHGTATRLGDPVEVQALTDVFHESTHATGWCWLGAVKSNIGHTGAAAGVAGLIKTVLQLENGELVPTVHFRSPNPLLRLESTPFRVCDRTRPWDGPELAAVSSFGVGGTNAHVVLAPAPRRTVPTVRPGPRLLTLSAASPAALHRARADLAGHLRASAPLPEVARTLAGRRRFDHREAVVAADPAEAARLLAAQRPAPAGGLERVAFLFPGQGTLRTAAGAAAYRLLSGFRGYFDEIRDATEVDLSPVVAGRAARADWFTDTVHQQLGLFALGYALGRQLRDWGVEPVALFGNSIGELTAATLAGVWEPADAAALVHRRAVAMRDTEAGLMVAVDAAESEVADRIAGHDGVTVAVSGPDRVVISGGAAAVEALLADDAFNGLRTRRLDTARAFHSAAMEPAADALRDAVTAVPGAAARLPLVSNTTGGWADPQAVRGADYWALQLRRPVLLARGMGTVLAAGCELFVELGPGSSMSAGLRRHPRWDAGLMTVPLLGAADGDPERNLLAGLGHLWERGAGLAGIAGIDAPGELPLRCSLPAHPFDPRDPDVDMPAPRAVLAKPASARAENPDLAWLWCRALGVAAAREDEDFFAAGGDSLMAVQLIGQVRAHAGCDLSVAEFTGAPTFGTLVRLVERTAGAPAAPGVVTLRAGVGRPLFLAADALGVTAGCRALAAALPAGQPVLGLEPPGGQAFRRIEDLAAHHVEAVLAAGRGGPHLLGGWSFGAVVAHEMAHQLTARGERVALLVCLDGFVPNGRGLPVATDPAFLRDTVRLRLGAALGVGPVGAVRRSREVQRRFAANLGALLRYRPRPVPCRAVLYRAGADRRAAARLHRRLSTLYEGIQVRPTGGGHWSMLAPPHVDLLAKMLGSDLGSAQK
jgi:phthiocerol/phenolphthiocerol synthesis type-I polyketide synthase E